MEPHDILLTTAELATALVGFAGIVVVFQRRGAEGWLRSDLARFWQMVAFALSALFFSLLPLVLMTAGRSDSFTWSTGSALMAVFVGGHAAGMAWALLRRELFQISEFSVTLAVVLLANGILVFCMLSANALGVVFQKSFTGYLVGLFYLVAVSAFFFVRLVHLGVSNPGDGSS